MLRGLIAPDLKKNDAIYRNNYQIQKSYNSLKKYMQMIDIFLKTNKDLCNKCKCYLPQAQTNIFQLYNEYIIQYMNIRCNQIVVDAGGGRSCSFAKHKALHKNTQIISVDISEEQLKYNHDVDKKIVADIMRGLPLETKRLIFSYQNLRLNIHRKA